MMFWNKVPTSCQTLCILGCGNLGTAILKSLLDAPVHSAVARFDNFIVCVRSDKSVQKLNDLFAEKYQFRRVHTYKNDNVKAVQKSDVVILGVDPSDVEATLKADGLAKALRGKLLISVVAGWTKESLERSIVTASPSSRVNGEKMDGGPLDGQQEEERKPYILRTLPNIAAQVSQSLTAIEDPGPDFPDTYMRTADAIFSQVGQTINVPPRLMAASTAVAGSTPAFWSIICDSFIDAAVATGMPRAMAQQQIYQSMRGTAEMLQGGMHPGILKDEGTSPAGCTIAGVMVLEEAGLRGILGKALREAVAVARTMSGEEEESPTNGRRHSSIS